MCVYIIACSYVYTHTYTQYSNLYRCMWTNIDRNMCMCVCIYMYIYICICIYVYIYTGVCV